MYMKSNVKKIGNQTEKDFANLMFNKGWWVHILNDKVNGQPFDIIMAKNSAVWFLDVKNVSGKNYFLHNRIEPNQKIINENVDETRHLKCGFCYLL